MSLARKEKRITVEEYFDLQRNTGKRYDFWDGKLIELEATTKAHNRIKRNDRTEKFFKYQRIPTVEQCVFISQKMMAVESFIRSTEDQWLFKALEQHTDQLVFPKLEIVIGLKDIYQGISLKTEE